MLIERGVLVRALKVLITLTDKKSVSPFDHIRFELTASGVAIAASDGTTTVWLTVPASDPIAFSVPARDILAAATGAATGDHIGFAVDGNRVVVTYPGARVTLATTPTTDLGADDDNSTFRERRSVDAGALEPALSWVSAAMNTDDATRVHLASVLVQGDQLVATDGKRMHVATVRALGWPRALLPSKAIQVLLRLLPGSGQLEVDHRDGAFRFTGEAWSIRTRLLAHEQFPPYQQVIPAPDAATFTMGVAASDLGAAVRRVGVGRGKQTVPLRITANGKIVLATTSADVERVANVDATHSTHDDLAGDHVILRDAVDFKGDVTLRFGDVLAPFVIDGGTRFAVVMPMRL